MQKRVSDRNLHGKGIAYAATPKISAMNLIRSLTQVLQFALRHRVLLLVARQKTLMPYQRFEPAVVAPVWQDQQRGWRFEHQCKQILSSQLYKPQFVSLSF